MLMLTALLIRASTPFQGDVSKDVVTYGPFSSVARFYMACFPFEKRKPNGPSTPGDEEAADGQDNNGNAHQLQVLVASSGFDAEENMDEPDDAAAAIVVVAAEPVDANAAALHNPAQLEEPGSTVPNNTISGGNGDNGPQPDREDTDPAGPSQQPRVPHHPDRIHASTTERVAGS